MRPPGFEPICSSDGIFAPRTIELRKQSILQENDSIMNQHFVVDDDEDYDNDDDDDDDANYHDDDEDSHDDLDDEEEDEVQDSDKN